MYSTVLSGEKKNSIAFTHFEEHYFSLMLYKCKYSLFFLS